MPVTGRKPKPPGEAVTRHKQVHDWTEVENTPNEDPPRLPRERPNGGDWPSWTRRKWHAWRRMPHTKTWTEADWSFCFDTLELVAKFHETSSTNLATEIRNRERVLGTTEDFRRDLRIRYVAPKRPTLAVVHDVDDYRDL